MDFSTKVGLAISGIGLVIDLIALFFGEDIARMSTKARAALLAIGTAMILVGLAVVFFWPSRDQSTSRNEQNGWAQGTASEGVHNGTTNNYFSSAPPPEPRPNLFLDFDKFFTWGYQWERTNVVLIGVRVANRGSIGTVISQSRLVMNLGGKTYEGNPESIPARGLDIPSGLKKPEHIMPDQALYERASDTPIQPGALIQGYLIFSFPQLPENIVNETTPEFVLTLVDAWGRGYDWKHVYSPKNKHLRYYPGLDKPRDNP